MLSAIVFAPLLGALLLLGLPKDRPQVHRLLALVTSSVPLLLAIVLAQRFNPSNPAFQFEERFNWIPSLGASYHLGVDGISLALIVLSALVFVLSVIAAWRLDHRTKEFFLWFLILQTAVYGVFAALDFLLFFVFWEAMLIPMYFIIGIWGGPKREYAATKFFIYTMAGSAFMVIGILTVYFMVQKHLGIGTFDMPVLTRHIRDLANAGLLTETVQLLVFFALFIGFAVKIPVFPFHTWLPAAHVEAPTPGSMILAGLLLKAGAYGLFRISLPSLPNASLMLQVVLATLGLINIVYGSFAAMAQRDLKRMVAYSSISHMGFVLLGFAAAAASSGHVSALLQSGYQIQSPVVQTWITRGAMATNGALYVMISHGLISPLLFYLVATVFYDRTHTRMLDELGGLYTKMPVAGLIMAFAAFANLGLPGLSGFIGEYFTFMAGFPLFQVITIIAAVQLLVIAGFHLVMIKKMLMGENPNPNPYRDLTTMEWVVAGPFVVLIALLGVIPGILLRIFDPYSVSLLHVLGGI